MNFPSPSSFPRPGTRFVSGLLLVATPAAAQVTISGALSDTTTGPLVSGTVYHTTGSIQVPPGSTLTIQPGAIVKFGFDHRFAVDGTLLCQGTGPDSIVFTDLRDDSAGGDTNGDGGSTAPAPGWWRGVDFSSGGSGSVLDGVTARYGGRFISQFSLDDCSATLRRCRAEQCSRGGFDLGSNSSPTLQDCVAEDCQGSAFDGVPLRALPGFSGLGASGNAFDRVRVTTATLVAGESVTVEPSQLVGGTVFIDTSQLLVPAGASLDLTAGSIVKMAFDGRVDVDGRIRALGTSSAPVIFTDLRNDAAGGDTNGDGAATVAASGWWRGIDFGPATDDSILRWTEVRFGGRFIAGVEMTSTAPLLQNCAIREIDGAGLALNASSRPTIDGLDVTGCAGDAIASAELEACEGFAGLDFSGNGFDRIQVTSAVIESGVDITIRPAQLFQNTVYVNTSVQVEAGARVAIEAGVVLKQSFDTAWRVDGLLLCSGTSASRITFTEERDDALGGDTNGDGALTAPAGGFWRGVLLDDTADGSVLSHVDLRYGGRFNAAIDLDDAAVTIERCRILDFANDGLDCNENQEPCSIDRVRVERCTGYAITAVRLDRMGDFVLPRASDNGFDALRVTAGTLASDTTIEPRNTLNGAIYCDTSVVIPESIELNLQPGVALKMGFDRRVAVEGSLSVRGSLDATAYVTSFLDDTIGGDSNGDGAGTTPQPGYWRGVHFSSTTDTSIVIGLEARYGGRFFPNILCESGLVALREVRSSHSSAEGMRVASALVPLERIVAFANAGSGLELAGSSMDVRQLTSVGNGGFGVEASSNYSGSVRDSILWNNVTGAATGLPAGRISFSNGPIGLGGSNGNIDLDPLFVDEMNGDLQLTAGSPCVDAGDPSSPLDPDSTRADMGAYFLNACAPDVVCTQAPSTSPCDPSLSIQGFASLSSPAPCTITLAEAPTNSFAIFFYGMGAPTTIAGAFGTICVGGPYQRTAPVPSGGDPLDGPCAGTFVFDFNAYAQSGADPAIVAGVDVIGHLWYRDGNAPGNALFSDGVRLPVCP
ncbi:MAG: hypothetical protein AAGB93_01245 [Planctomycetota bacterium]